MPKPPISLIRGNTPQMDTASVASRDIVRLRGEFREGND